MRDGDRMQAEYDYAEHALELEEARGYRLPYPSRLDAFRYLAQLESEEGELARELVECRRQIQSVRGWIEAGNPYTEPEADPLLSGPSPVTAEHSPDRSAA